MVNLTWREKWIGRWEKAEKPCGCEYKRREDFSYGLALPYGYKYETKEYPTDVQVDTVTESQIESKGACFIRRVYEVPKLRCERCGDTYLDGDKRSFVSKERIWFDDIQEVEQ